MEKNGVTKAKPAINITKKALKKMRKQAQKSAKKAEKRERKDIRAAYTKALKKQNTDKMLAIIAILLTVAPIAVQFVVDKTDKERNQ